MNRKKIIVISGVTLVVVLLGGGFWAYQKYEKQKENVAKIEMPAEKNYFEINDEISGVYFHIGKNFDRMTAQELQLKNPVFIYGFSARSDKSAYCIVSQTKRDKSGVMKISDLSDGVLAQVKKGYPDVTLESSVVVSVGENNQGAKIVMNYMDNKVSLVQEEVVGITDTTATFAFCITPKAVLDLYKEDFNLFLGSLRITN